MSARNLLADLGAAGISVRSEGVRLIVEPASKLTPGLRERIRADRTELLQTLPLGDYDAAILAGTAPAADYLPADLIELERLVTRWGELSREPEDETRRTLELCRRMAPVDVRPNLEEFRRIVAEQEARR